MQSKDVNEILSDIEKLKNVLSSDVNLESDFVKAKTSDFITFLEKEAKDAMESSKFEREAGPEAKTMKMSVNDENVDSVGFRRWAESKVVPASPQETLTLGVHSLMIENKFANLAEIPSTVPGFAPSIREVNPGKFVPDQWATSSSSTGLLYKHPKVKAPFNIMYKGHEGDEMLIVLSHKHSVILETKLKLSDMINTSALAGAVSVVSPTAFFSNMERFRKEILVPILESISHIVGENLFVDPKSAPHTSLSDPAPGQFAPPARPMRVGDNDLNPVGVPDFDRHPKIIDPLSGGNLVGPGHPLFGGNPAGLDRRDPGYPTFPRAPQPRFDPYGPVPGANGPDFGKSPRSESYGEPEPDHLKPPGVPDPVQVDQIDPNEPPQSYFPRAGQGRGYLGRRGGGRGLGPF